MQLHYAERSQRDAVPERHPDMGSSCCSLFSALVAKGAVADLSALTLPRLEELLRKTVVAFDALAGSGAIAEASSGGAHVEHVVQFVFADAGLRAVAKTEVGDRIILQRCGENLCRRGLPAALLVTGLPLAGSERQQTGCTFVIVFGEDAVHVVDSHRHARVDGPQGLLLARAPAWPDAVEFIFGPAGLLEQLDCGTHLVEFVQWELADPVSHAEPAVDVAGSEPGEAPAGSQLSTHGGLQLVDQQPVGRQLVEYGSGFACRQHAKFTRGCGMCSWLKHGRKFRDALSYTDRTTLEHLSAIGIAPDRADFAIGCCLCSRYCKEHPGATPKKPLWATFSVTGAGVSLDGVKKHRQTALHTAALHAYAAPAPAAGSSPSKSGSSLSSAAGPPCEDGGTPRQGKFFEVVRACVQGQSAGSWAASQPHTSEAQSDLISTGVFRDESRQAYRKIVASAAAVIDAEQQDLLRKAVRIAFADDDRDQHRILRIRVVWEAPTVGYAEFFGAVLKDYGFDAEACNQATIAGLQRLCSTRAGSQADGPAAELDEQLWEHVRSKIFCGATDGAAVAIKGVNLLSQSSLPALRYQFRDRPHTTRTCVKMAFETCPGSEEVRKRLITNKGSFARRAKHSLRFREVWLRKQREDPDAFWAVCQDLSYAEQRYDSRSKPMATFLLKLGPALEVLSELSQDPRKQHRQDAFWARDLLEFLGGRQGFLRMVLFAIDTDFAVATHKLVRVQDRSDADIALAADEVQACVDTCRVLFEDGRIFDKAPNGTYTNHLLHGFKGVTRQLLVGAGGHVAFGWPNLADDTLLKEAVLHAKKLYRAVAMFFQYNFPHHAWRTRFQAFSLDGPLSHTARRSHILALAGKEGVDPGRAWEQFFEALPHVMRFYKATGEARAAWASYLDHFCRARCGRPAWRQQADALAPLVLTYLGVMDGTSDVERGFAQMTLVECKRARRHHTEQQLQDILKVRLHAPDEFRDVRLGDDSWGESVGAFVRAAQVQYADFFGKRHLASRSLHSVGPLAKAVLYKFRRPRWQHTRPKSTRTRAARQGIWEEEVQRMLAEQRRGVVEESLVQHIPVASEAAGLLQTAKNVIAKKTEQHLQYQYEQERKGLLAAPPPAIRKAELLSGPPRKKAKKAAGSQAVARAAVAKQRARPAQPLTAGSGSAAASLALVPRIMQPAAATVAIAKGTSIFLTKQAWEKHGRSAAALQARGVVTPDEAAATHRIYASKADAGTLKLAGGRAMTLSALLQELRCA